MYRWIRERTGAMPRAKGPDRDNDGGQLVTVICLVGAVLVVLVAVAFVVGPPGFIEREARDRGFVPATPTSIGAGEAN
jgi:hypothetical protein